MSTAISELYNPVRAFLGDFSTTVRKYSDTAIADVVRALVRCGEVPGITVSADSASLEPGLSTPLLYAQVVYRACLKFVAPNVGAYSYRTRAMSESFGHSAGFVLQLESALYDMENGAGFAAFVDFQTWAMSVTGVCIWSAMSEVKINAPVATVSVGRDGITVNG
jgi:hypothetical protein